MMRHPLSVITVLTACTALVSIVAHGPIALQAIALGALVLTSLWAYGVLHAVFHDGRLKRRARDGYGLAISSLLGISWRLYNAHHANHHQHGNGPKDHSRTIDRTGRHVPGWKYLYRHAIIPFFFQLVPGSVIVIARKRPASVWLDEGARVSVRVAVLLAGGPTALLLLLLWQFGFLVQLNYVNYLQHFDAPVGGARVWSGRMLNALLFNLGQHDQHHRNPGAREYDLRKLPTDEIALRAPGVLDPVAFTCFLASPEALRAYLTKRNGAHV